MTRSHVSWLPKSSGSCPHRAVAFASYPGLSCAPRASSGSRSGSPPACAAGSACRSHTRPGSRCSADLPHIKASSGTLARRSKSAAVQPIRAVLQDAADTTIACTWHVLDCMEAPATRSVNRQTYEQPASALRKVLNNSACSARRGLSTFSRYVLCSPVTACWTHLSMSRLPPNRECLVNRQGRLNHHPTQQSFCLPRQSLTVGS